MVAAVDVNMGGGEGGRGDADLEGKGAFGCVDGGGRGTGGTGPTVVVFEVGVWWVAGWVGGGVGGDAAAPKRVACLCCNNLSNV